MCLTFGNIKFGIFDQVSNFKSLFLSLEICFSVIFHWRWQSKICGCSDTANVSLVMTVANRYCAFKIHGSNYCNAINLYKPPCGRVNRQRWGRGHKARGQGQGSGHKKIRGQGQGQGQPFGGQTLSRPRTGMLEAKAKDKGHSRKCSLKKKVSKKSFSGNLQFIGAARIFDWEGLNHKSHAMTSSKICLLALNQDLAKGEGLN